METSEGYTGKELTLDNYWYFSFSRSTLSCKYYVGFGV